MKKFDVIVNPFTHNVIVSHKSKEGSEVVEFKADGLIDSWSSFTMNGFPYDIHFYYDQEFSVSVYTDEEYQVNHHVKLTIVNKDV